MVNKKILQIYLVAKEIVFFIFLVYWYLIFFSLPMSFFQNLIAWLAIYCYFCGI